jgi:hypothetical protein
MVRVPGYRSRDLVTETWSGGFFFYMKLREKFKMAKVSNRYFYFELELNRRPLLLNFIGGTRVPGEHRLGITGVYNLYGRKNYDVSESDDTGPLGAPICSKHSRT